ncbi:MAG TPA: hypothetical protein VKZ50_04520 [bacterium]|nr:hypothetical protein [bacterium]
MDKSIAERVTGLRRAFVVGTVVIAGATVTLPTVFEPTSGEDVGCAVTGDCRSDNPAITSSKSHTADPSTVFVNVNQDVAAQIVTPSYSITTPSVQVAMQSASHSFSITMTPRMVVVLVIAGVGVLLLTTNAAHTLGGKLIRP